MNAVVSFFLTHGFLLEMLLAFALFTWWLPHRPRFPLRVAASVAALAALSLVWSICLPQTAAFLILRYILIFSLCTLGVGNCFAVTGSQALFYALVAGCAQHLSFKGAKLLSMCLGAWFSLPAVLGLCFYGLFVVLIHLVLFRFFGRPLRHTGVEHMGFFTISVGLVGMLLSVNVFQNLFDHLSAGISPALYLLYEGFDVVCCLFLLWLQCEIGSKGSLQQQNDILQHLIHQQKNQMELSRESIELINIKCHDLKKMLSSRSGELHPQELEELQRCMNIYDTALQTGNETLDVLLAEKLLLCQARNIHVSCIADGACLNFLAPPHLYAMVGNALDNALEATSQVQDPSQRYIQIHIQPKRGMVRIHIENSYQGQLTFRDGLPVTAKDDRFHGFGTKSIRMVAQKYGGFLSLQAKDQIFCLDLLFPSPDAPTG